MLPKHFAKWKKKLVTKDHILYDFMSMKCPEQVNYEDRKQVSDA